MKSKMMMLLGLLVMGATAVYGSQTDGQPKMNGKLRVTTLSPEEIRYTGKPYSKALGAYVFNYRNYDPQIARWTTPDPSGFPDGANNCIYAPVPTVQFDMNGLWVVTTYDPNQPSWVGEEWKQGPIYVVNVLSGVGYEAQKQYQRQWSGWSDAINSTTGDKGKKFQVNANVTFSNQKEFSFTLSVGGNVSWVYGGSTSGSYALGAPFDSPDIQIKENQWWEAQLVIGQMNIVTQRRTTGYNNLVWGDWEAFDSTGAVNSPAWGIRWELLE